MGLEERLARLERLLSEVLRRLERLEEALGSAGEEARLAILLAEAFAKPIQEAADAARRAARALSRLPGADEVTVAIVEALAAQGPLSLRGLEREVRRLRGSASRAAIRSRLDLLLDAGLICVEKKGRRLVIRLAGEEGCSGGSGG